MKYYLFLVALVLTLSCSSRYHDHLIMQPTNVNLETGKWLIDEPLLEKLDVSVVSVIVENYKEGLISKYSNFKYIYDFNGISSLNKALEKTSKTLDLYKSQTNYNFLVSTKLEVINCKNPSTKFLSIKLSVYSLETKSKIFEKEYHSWKKNVKTLKSDSFKEFVGNSMEKAIKNFIKKDNWKLV